MKPVQIVVITGLSGSGKSTAIRALEDLDYFCIDNMPVVLLPKFLGLIHASDNPIEKLALVVDARGAFLTEAETTFLAVKAEGHHLEILFLEADDETLVQRYSETRRKHPLAPKGSVEEGVLAERHALQNLRLIADHVIGTTSLNVHELRRAVGQLYGDQKEDRQLIVNIVSFGFKAGLPKGADLVFDVRFLLNPHFIPELRPQTGLQEDVSKYVLSQPKTQTFLKHLFSMLDFLLPQYETEGKSYLTIAIGCTGGKHRSVALAQFVAQQMSSSPYTINTHHRDIPLRVP
jgi:UPF0042 nucleotide-binding protein